MIRLFFTVQLIFLVAVIGAAQSMDLEVLQDTVWQGDFVQINLSISDIEGPVDKDLLDLSEFTVVGQSTTSSMSFIDGSMHSNNMYSFTIRAEEPGTFYIPAIEYKSGDTDLHIDEVSIVVLPREHGEGRSFLKPEKKKRKEMEKTPTQKLKRKMKRI